MDNAENQQKPKMKTKTKRLIAQMVVGAIIALDVALVSAGWKSVDRDINYGKQLEDLNIKQTSVYASVKASEEFQQEYRNAYKIYTDAYTNNILTFDEYSNKLEYLNSNDFIKDTLIKIDTSTYAQVDEIEKDISAITEKKSANEYSSIPLAIGTGVGVISLPIVSCYAVDLKKREKKEKVNAEQNKTL